MLLGVPKTTRWNKNEMGHQILIYVDDEVNNINIKALIDG
jgi:hypothetical protein